MKFVTFAFDRKTFKYLNNVPGVHAVYFNLHASEGNIEFRKGDFSKISVGKFRAVYSAMKLGYNVIFSDPDVVILKDPIPIFQGAPDMDYMHSLNVRCAKTTQWGFYDSIHEGNTGFYFIRSKPSTIELYRQFFEGVPRPGQPFAFLDDQTLFWKFIRTERLRNHAKSHDTLRIDPINRCASLPSRRLGGQPESKKMLVRTCPLDVCKFPAGAVADRTNFQLTIDKLKYRRAPLYMLHANYLSGNDVKQQRLFDEGFWLATQTADNSTWAGQCAPFVEYPILAKLNALLLEK
jgi:hypothetical protein